MSAAQTMKPSFELSRDSFERLVLVTTEGQRHVGVVPVRSFPIAAPRECVSLVSTEGHEVAWVQRLDDLPQAQRELVEQDLASREFVPEIRRLKRVSTFATPSTWEVETDRGETELVLKAEDDIRRLSRGSLLIADSHGVQYLIRDVKALDRASRRMLDRFL